mgnify:CR=1 FL=1
MICALMIGRAGSVSLPGKNTLSVLGKKLCEYPLIACKNSQFVNKIDKNFIGQTEYFQSLLHHPSLPYIPLQI